MYQSTKSNSSGECRCHSSRASRCAAQAYEAISCHLQERDTPPAYNLASFVSSAMDKEAERLILESINKNFVDSNAYPRTSDIERRCVQIIAQLFHAPRKSNARLERSYEATELAGGVEPAAEAISTTAVGSSTVGSSEAVMLCTLAMKRRWLQAHRNRHETAEQTKGHLRKLNIVMGSTAHVCWMKAAQYFDLSIETLPISRDRFVLHPEEAVDAIDEYTIGICCILLGSLLESGAKLILTFLGAPHILATTMT